LRAVGAQRRLIWRLIGAEVTLLALTGALTGTLMGLHLAWVSAGFYRDLAGLPVRLVVPYVPAAIGWLVLVVLALLAAVPAVLSITRKRPSVLLAAGRAG
jgi:ABC-type antimicrobial peptide transport system permease subunit